MGTDVYLPIVKAWDGEFANDGDIDGSYTPAFVAYPFPILG